MSDIIMLLIAAYVIAGLVTGRLSYIWWSRRYGHRAALGFAVVTFIVPPSIIFELTRWNRR